jgi:hypothetical protein
MFVHLEEAANEYIEKKLLQKAKTCWKDNETSTKFENPPEEALQYTPFHIPYLSRFT